LPRILLVDNNLTGGKTRELEDSLSSNGASVDVLARPRASAELFDRFDGVVLSGSSAMLSEEGSQSAFREEVEAIRASRVPLLGVCFGHQLIGLAYGSRVVRAARPTKRYVETEVLVWDGPFSGMPRKMSVYESHHELVDPLPDGFVLLARSATSPVAAMRHRRLPVFGVQFHPERNSSENPDGDAFVRNFVRGCAGGRGALGARIRGDRPDSRWSVA
jgi:GMP synthase (glutamine-hydrolysing)